MDDKCIAFPLFRTSFTPVRPVRTGPLTLNGPSRQRAPESSCCNIMWTPVELWWHKLAGVCESLQDEKTAGRPASDIPLSDCPPNGVGSADYFKARRCFTKTMKASKSSRASGRDRRIAQNKMGQIYPCNFSPIFLGAWADRPQSHLQRIKN